MLAVAWLLCGERSCFPCRCRCLLGVLLLSLLQAAQFRMTSESTTLQADAPEVPPRVFSTVVVIPASLRVPLPPGAVAGSRLDFRHHGLTYSMVVPEGSSGCSTFDVRLSVADWTKARKRRAAEEREEAKRRREAAARVREAEAKRRKEVRDNREVNSLLQSLIYSLQAEERELRLVVSSMISTLEATERERQARERQLRDSRRKEAQVEREVHAVLRRILRQVEATDTTEREVARVVDRLVSHVVRAIDPRYAGLDEPEYAQKQLEALESYLISLSAPPGLLQGWTIRVDVRQTGGTAGETDLYFFDAKVRARSRTHPIACPGHAVFRALSIAFQNCLSPRLPSGQKVPLAPRCGTPLSSRDTNGPPKATPSCAYDASGG